MTYKFPTKKQAERFQKNATDRLIRLGFKKVEGGPRDFCLDTPLGQLWASPYDDWIACRFDNLSWPSSTCRTATMTASTSSAVSGTGTVTAWTRMATPPRCSTSSRPP